MSSRLIYSGCGCEVIEHFPDYCPTCCIAELEAAQTRIRELPLKITDDEPSRIRMAALIEQAIKGETE